MNNDSQLPPKVFVSHASEDKQRFVLAFAERLRNAGVDAWLDVWEMPPGDDLVDGVFQKGIKNASVVVVVVSKYSVKKRWVREELNVAVVKRINTGCKLIPVVIDDCEVPEALTAIVHERITNIDSYDSNFDSILASIFGRDRAPPIGHIPTHLMSVIRRIGDLTADDSEVLRIACEWAIKQGDCLIEPSVAFKNGESYTIPVTRIQSSMDALEHRGFINVGHAINRELDHFLVTVSGFETYARAFVSDYDALTKSVAESLVNRKLTGNQEIATQLDQPRVVIDHILDLFENNGFIKQSRYANYDRHVYQVNEVLKRTLS